VFSDRQPGELVALFTRAIADLKAASGSPEISNDSKKSNSQRAVTAGPKIVTVCARLVFGTSQRYWEIPSSNSRPLQWPSSGKSLEATRRGAPNRPSRLFGHLT